MSATKLITERFSFTGGKVDRAAGTIANCVICGLTSQNGRDYPVTTLRRDFAKYEGAPSNCDHGRDDAIDRRLGWFTDVKPGDDGRPRGTYHLLLTHPMAERVMEAAEKNPTLFGFSHVVEAKTSRRNGREIVESIDRVISIDLVATPATNPGGLFEGKSVGLTVKALCEALVKHPKTTSKQVKPLKTLAEMDGMGYMPTAMDAPPAEDADPADGVKEAFKTAVMHIVEQAMSGDMDPKEAIGKIKKLLASHGEVNGDGAPAEPDADDDPTTPEGKKRSTGGAILEALTVCESVGFAATRVDLEIVAASPADRRIAVAERLKKTAEGGPERPHSHGRAKLELPDPKGGKGTVAEGKGAPPDVKSFVASIKG